MQILQKKEGDALTLSISGRIDTITAPELEKCIDSSIDGIKKLIIDLKDMSYTSSAGLRVILKAQKIMSKQGELKIVNVSSDIMDIFDITGFSDILNIE